MTAVAKISRALALIALAARAAVAFAQCPNTAPTPVSPTPGQTGVAIRPTLMWTDVGAPKYDIYLAAAEFGKPQDIAKLRSQQTAAAPVSNGAAANAIEVFSALGLVEDAFAAANHYQPGAALGGDTSFLFYPLTLPMRRDPPP